MPLVRLQVRNEYGLGDPETYRTAQKDDSRALLEGIAVAGLVGILRQIGDLAEFLAEVFQDIHDKVATTAARSQDLMARIQHLEAGLPSLERASLAQTSHIHFAYTAGSDWHASLRTEQNHLTRGDIPGFIMDSYDECRGPPRLFLLDKFDAAGVGACLRRYSDPSFFKMEWAASELEKVEKTKREKKSLKTKKKSRRQWNGPASDRGSFSRNCNGIFYTVDFAEQNQNNDNLLIYAKSKSFSSGTKTSYMERLFDIDVASEHGKVESNALYFSPLNEVPIQAERSAIIDDQATSYTEDTLFAKSLHRGNNSESPHVRCDEKAEVVISASSSCIQLLKNESQSIADEKPGLPEFNVEGGIFNIADMDHHVIPVDEGRKPDSCAIGSQNSDVVSETDNYVDALNIMESEVETDSENSIKKGTKFHPVYNEAMIKSVSDDQVQTHFSDHCDIQIPPLSVNLLNDELVDRFSIPNVSASGTLHLDVFENDGDSAPDIETKTKKAASTISSSFLNDELSGHFSQIDLTNIPRNPVVDVFENGIDVVPNIEMKNILPPIIPSFLKDELTEHVSQVDLSNGNVPGTSSFGIFKNEIHDAPVIEMKKSAINDELPDCSVSDQLVTANNIITVGSETSRESCLDMQATSLNFWTNGGLLGLQPSKPPDFSKTKAPEDICNSQRYMSASDSHMQRYDGSFGRESGYSTVSKSFIKVENGNHSNVVAAEGTSILFSGGKLPVMSSTDVQSTVSIPTDMPPNPPNNSHQIKSVGELGFSEKSRSDGARLSQKGVTFDTTNYIPNLQNTELLYEPAYVDTLSKSGCGKESDYVVGSAGNFDSVDSYCSECSSPPLEHMKISYNPVNDLDPSIVELDFPDELRLHERIKDTFSPSFHWLPQSIAPLRGIRKGPTTELDFLSMNCHNSQNISLFEGPKSEVDSDEDTFCKGSLNFSDDMLSQDSELNSDLWECSDVNGSKVGQYDGLSRISSPSSISSSGGHEETTFHSVNPNHHGPDPCSNFRISSEAGSGDSSSSGLQNSQTQFQGIDSGSNKLLSFVFPTTGVDPSSPPTLLMFTNPTVSLEECHEIQNFAVKQHQPTNMTAIMCRTDERKTLLEQVRSQAFAGPEDGGEKRFSG